jgi:hypothetical protein
MLLKTTTIRDGNTTPILVREATECSRALFEINDH